MLTSSIDLSESPPKSKKLSRILTFSISRTVSTAFVSIVSFSVVGATYSVSVCILLRSISGNAFLFALPLAVIGILSRCVNICGIIYLGSFELRIVLKSLGLISVPV